MPKTPEWPLRVPTKVALPQLPEILHEEGLDSMKTRAAILLGFVAFLNFEIRAFRGCPL